MDFNPESIELVLTEPWNGLGTQRKWVPLLAVNGFWNLVICGTTSLTAITNIAGFAVGCLMICSGDSASAGNGGLYYNSGSTTSSTWTAITLP